MAMDAPGYRVIAELDDVGEVVLHPELMGASGRAYAGLGASAN